MLFNSIETISNAKNLEDKFDTKQSILEANLERQNKEN